MKVLFILSCVLISFNCHSQDSSKIDVEGDYVNGDKITNKNISYYNTKKSDAILNISKYIDTLKNIYIFPGRNSFQISMANLRTGCYPFGFIGIMNADKILKIQLINGILKINSEINGFDEKYIAHIVNNKVVMGKDYHFYANDSSFEMFDDYYIPVLQIEISKKRNGIYFYGAFNFSNSYTIVSGTAPMVTRGGGMPKLQMTVHQRDSLLAIYRYEAKSITPIHE